jgi:hypothetical protein
VALEAGNSPSVIFSNYRELVTEKDADAWFGVTPGVAAALKKKQEVDRAAKVLTMPKAAAA